MTNRRNRVLLLIAATAIILSVIIIYGMIMPEAAYSHNFREKRLAPSFQHLFGTDHFGRDMFSRTIKGLSTSICLGISASIFSGIIALLLGMISGMTGGKTDKAILAAVDIFMGIPHIVLLMLISIAAGKGFRGVAISIMLTHWPSLTRVIRSEVMEIRSMQYVKIASKLGVSRLTIMFRHILPHVFPQFIVGLVLLFPHVILHEAAITFLGFGLPIDMPAIGVILSEAMNYLSAGMWWLVLYPGLALLITVIVFEALGDNLQLLLSPVRSQE